MRSPEIYNTQNSQMYIFACKTNITKHTFTYTCKYMYNMYSE